MAREITTSETTSTSRPRGRAAAIIAALTLASILSGCVVAPAPGYYAFHPHRYYYYW